MSLMRLSTFFGRTPPPAMMLMRPCACLTKAAMAVLPCAKKNFHS